MIGIIYRPIVTEKLTHLQDKGIYAFEVDPKATKIDIARAVKKRWNVTVTKVRTMNYKGKTKSQMTRKGRFAGRTRLPNINTPILLFRSRSGLPKLENPLTRPTSPVT